MKENITVGIVGQGFVGSAVREKFRKTFNVLAWDKKWSTLKMYKAGEEEKSMSNYDQLEQLVEHSDFVFVCVPTPMYDDGECDTRIVESVISEIGEACDKLDKKTVAIVKSTIPPGTTIKLNSISERVNVQFNPEFLTEANAIEDYENQDRIVMGIDGDISPKVMYAFETVFEDATLSILSTTDAEMVKYMTNLFLATKVSFFNDMYKVCESVGADYDLVIESTLLDPRIGKSHYSVPGPDGDFGYGGHCFPKDVNAILNIALKKGISTPTLLGAHTTNQIVRKNRDWESMEGRAVSKREEAIETEK